MRTSPFLVWRLCRNGKMLCFVILNEVKNLMISNESIIGILRLSPQNDITTQSLDGGGEGKGEGGRNHFGLDLAPPPLHPLPRRGGEFLILDL